jgi:adenine-specific DNA-methyltransferase
MATQQTKRRIADSDSNVYVANGVPAHRATTIAPPSFFEPFPSGLDVKITERQSAAEKLLAGLLGKPWFSAPGFILYAHDCVDGLRRISKSTLRVNLTITSPPYNIGKEYEDIARVDDYTRWCGEWMTLIHSVTTNNGSFWLNVGYLEVESKGLCVPIPYLIWNKSPFYLLQEVVWRYGAGVSTRKRLCPRNEKWLYYVKDAENYIFNLDDIRDPNVKYPNQKRNGKFRCNPLGKNPSDVWEFPKVTTGSKRSSKERTDHPAQFPLPIVERVVKASSNIADVILDPFAGSSSTGIATAGFGRLFIGFELREDYCDLAAERFQRFWSERMSRLAQSRLF